VLVLTSYPGASPEVVESDVTKPLEYAINTVSGASSSVELDRRPEPGLRRVPHVDRHDEGDAGRPRQDRPGAAELPEGREGAARHPGRPGEPAADRLARGDVADDVAARSFLASPTRRSSRRWRTFPGVARIEILGRATRQILIQIKPNAVTSLGIGVDQVINASVPRTRTCRPGRITRGQQDSVVRIEGKIKDPAQFARIIVAQQGGANVYLSQVADVIDGEKEETRSRGSTAGPSITLDIQKSQDANIVDTGRGITAAIEALKKRLPPTSSCGSPTRPAETAERASTA
jgi:multidrug efflux pump subunit AcrB